MRIPMTNRSLEMVFVEGHKIMWFKAKSVFNKPPLKYSQLNSGPILLLRLNKKWGTTLKQPSFLHP